MEHYPRHSPAPPRSVGCSAAWNILGQQRRDVRVGPSGHNLFFIVHQSIIIPTLRAEPLDHRALPMIFRLSVRTACTLPKIIGRLTAGLFVVSFRFRHPLFLNQGNAVERPLTSVESKAIKTWPPRAT